MTRKNRRTGGKKGGRGRGRAQPEPTPISAEDVVPALVDLKLRILRTVRALDAAGVQPGDHRDAPEALAACADLDGLLTRLIELLDREPPDADAEVPAEIRELLSAGPQVLDGVFGALPRRLRQTVRGQLELVGCSAAEAWLEVDGLRRAAGDDPEALAAEEEMLQGGEDTALLFALAGPEPEQDARVAQLESEELPESGDARDWLLTLPTAWLQTMARLWDVDASRERSLLAENLAEVMRHPEQILPVLAEGLGRRERTRLAEFLAAEVRIHALRPDVREGLDVPWDWSQRLPPGCGGKLRAFGLVYVGRRDGEPVVAVPPDLVEPLIEGLREADPKGWRSLSPFLRDSLEGLLQEEDDDWLPGDEDGLEGLDLSRKEAEQVLSRTRELRAWRRRADRVAEVVLRHLDEDRIPEDLVEAFYEPLSAVRTTDDEDMAYFMLLAAYDWRDGPDGRTLAEEVLTTQELDPDERAILESQCRSQPRLYRIVSAEGARSVEVEDAFVPGPSRRLDEPELAVGLEAGSVFPARLFRAGPHTLFQPMGDPVPPEAADDAITMLKELFEVYAKQSGCVDREAFLRDCPVGPSLATLLLVGGDEADDELPRPHPRSDKPEKIYVLDVDLMGSEPPVTRRVQLSGHRTLDDLHDVLQCTMGWENDHLHSFEARDGSWRYADPQYDVAGAGDETQVTLDAIAPRKGSRFYYEYDFGDSWVHEIRVVERLDPKKAGPEPLCLGGQNACPPEDSGGVPGYAWKLDVLADPTHVEHADVLEWMGEEFDPSHFDLDAVNRYLRPQPTI